MALDVRGTPAWQIRRYLELLGGERRPDGTYYGPGWQAHLSILEHKAFGTLLPRVIVTFNGEPGAVSTVESALRLRATRVGG